MQCEVKCNAMQREVQCNAVHFNAYPLSQREEEGEGEEDDIALCV